MKKPANTRSNISDNIKNRWSPWSFDSKPVEKEKLLSILEAGRWAASAFNEQPWRFAVGKNGDEKHHKILASLIEWNRQWAGTAPILILNLAKKTFRPFRLWHSAIMVLWRSFLRICGEWKCLPANEKQRRIYSFKN